MENNHMDHMDSTAPAIARDAHDAHGMGGTYDDFADAFAKADELPTWRWVGKAAMEDVLAPVLGPESTFLDLGAASARVEAGVLLPRGVNPANIVGVEISPDQVELARTRIPEATFVVGDVSDPTLLSERDGAFDAVFSHMVFEHLDDEQFARTCANAHRLLAPGGIFAFVVTHPDKMTDLEGNLVTTYGPFETSAPWGGTLHNFRRSVDDTVVTVESAGFAVEFTDEVNFPVDPPAGLSEADEALFVQSAEKYRRYPAIRLCVRAKRL
jgi:SAM-dependent methyltransferase